MHIDRFVRRGGLAALVAAMLSAAGCNRPATPPSSSGEAASVRVVRPEKKALRVVVEQPGSVQAYEETQLFARVPGYVRLDRDPEGRIVYDIGTKVRGPRWFAPGEALARLAVPELESETRQKQALVRQAEAEVTQAEKATDSAKSNVAVAEAGVIEAQALYKRWESESGRMAGLKNQGVVDVQAVAETQHQFEAAAARLTSARASVGKAKNDQGKAEADVEAARARVDVARAEAGRLEALLAYSVLRAPYDGVIMRRRVNTGDFVQPGSGKSDWLFTVSRLDPVRVVVAVPEADAALVQGPEKGKPTEVRLTVQAYGGPDLTGPVARTSWDLESAARTLRAEIDLPNPDGTLRPGMYVHARITCALPEAWVLPAAAVVKDGDELVCFLVEDGKAVRTPVQVGRGDGQSVRLLKRLRPGSAADWVEFTGAETVAARAQGLTDGQAVQETRP